MSFKVSLILENNKKNLKRSVVPSFIQKKVNNISIAPKPSMMQIRMMYCPQKKRDSYNK